MHVPGWKNNLVSIDKFEDRGYDVVFGGGKEFLHHKYKGQVNKIGIHVKNLYKLDVDGFATLMGKAHKVVSRDDGELWHRIIGHLYHSSLKIMQHIMWNFQRVLLRI